jgi:hypothetical protein
VGNAGKGKICDKKKGLAAKVSNISWKRGNNTELLKETS